MPARNPTAEDRDEPVAIPLDPEEALRALLKVDPNDWAEAVQSQEEFFESFGSRLPRGIREEHETLAHRIQDTTTPADLRGRDSG